LVLLLLRQERGIDLVVKKDLYLTKWREQTTTLLKSIVDDQGDIYLDELQQELFELGSGG
jgi:hypothetical protein